jgi:hypothetical protein
MGALNRIEDMMDSFGASTILPEHAAELGPAMMRMRAMAAQVQGTGVINPSEVETINATLPDASSLVGMGTGRFLATLRGWRSEIEGAVRSNLEDLGTPPAEIELAMRELRGGEGAATTSTGRAREGSVPDEPLRVRTASGAVRTLAPAMRAQWEALSDEERREVIGEDFEVLP